jgi:cardiolipin synthase
VIYPIDWDHTLWLGTGLLYFAALINCFRILGARRSPASNISWLWAHLTIPFLAVPLYWFLGRVRLVEYQRRRHIRNFEKTGFARIRIDLSVAEQGVGKIAEFSKIFGHFGPLFLPSLNHGELLIDGISTFDAIFAAMNNAKRYIVVQYYILQSDKLGIELKEILLKKAKEGVKIFLLYDDMGSFWISKQYVKDLQRAGVRTARFLPVTSIKRLFLLNFRNHRKLVVVDGLHAFSGGLNVGEEYVSSRFKRQRDWRDTHLMVSGPAVRQLEDIFFTDWHFATGEKLADQFIKYWQEPFFHRGIVQLKLETAKDYVQIVPSGPSDHTAIGMLVFSAMIQAAKKRIWLATPYFVPDEPLQKDLELAVLRGVDVRLLLPKVSDHRFVHWVTLSYAEQMQRKGVRVFLYSQGFTHQKVILVDDDLAAVGTANFDYRAMYLNFETMVLVHGRRFATTTEAMLLNDFDRSLEFVPEPNHRIRALTHLRDNAARLLAPLL